MVPVVVIAGFPCIEFAVAAGEHTVVRFGAITEPLDLNETSGGTTLTSDHIAIEAELS